MHPKTERDVTLASIPSRQHLRLGIVAVPFWFHEGGSSFQYGSLGEILYRVTDLETGDRGFVRAYSKAQAKTKVLDKFPSATIAYPTTSTDDVWKSSLKPTKRR